MKALISGQAGIALLIENENCWSVSAEEPDRQIPCAQDEMHYLLAGTDDLVALEPTTAEAACAELQKVWSRDRALQLLLILLDSDEDLELREMAADCLEDRLADSSLTEFLMNRLCESSLPVSSNLKTAIRIADDRPFPATAALLNDLENLQPAISVVCDAFEQLDDSFFVDPDFPSRMFVRRWLSDHGVFRRLATQHDKSVGTEVLSLLTDPAIKRLPSANRFLSTWVAPLKSRLPKEVHSEQDREASRQRGQKSIAKPHRSRHEQWQLAERQIREILDLLDRGEESKALKWATELVYRQEQSGEGNYAVQSLSNLAIEMKRRGRADLQLHFAERAAKSVFADPQARNQFADALLCNHQAESAIGVYEATIQRFGSDAVSRNGRAEALRELNRLDEALQQYDETIQRFGSNSVSQCGRAEVLRELNRLDEALQQYDETIQRFGSDVVSQCGRAEVLRELNRLDEALQQYDETIQRFGSDVVSRNGRAEVLRELNRLDESLAQIVETVEMFPHNSYARTSGAAILIELQQYDSALKIVEPLCQERRIDWVAFHVRGMAMLRKGDYLEAAAIFSRGLKDCKIPSQEPYFRNGLAAVRLQQRDASAALQLVQNEFGDVADVIRMHAFGEQLRLRECRESNDSLLQYENRLVRETRALLEAGYLSAEATKVRTDEWRAQVFQKECRLLLRIAA